MTRRRALGALLVIVVALLGLALVVALVAAWRPNGRETLVDLLAPHWQAIATLVTAGVAIVLAVFAWSSARAAQRAVDAANRQAAAAARSVEASETVIYEMRRDRELEYRPRLTVELAARPTSQDTSVVVATIVNVGRGPALNCAFNASRIGPAGEWEWWTEGPFDLGAGATLGFEAWFDRGPEGQRFRVVTDGLATVGDLVAAVAYEDLVGTRYRTRLQGHRVGVDVWRPGDIPVHDWTRWRDLQGGPA